MKTHTPTVSSVSPGSGPTSGGTAVTIKGANFASGATVMFGTRAAASVTFQNAKQILATTPAGSVGAVTVKVTVGGQSGSLAGGFTYITTPTVSGVSPGSGPTSGGTAVTITGTNFVTGATVQFGTATATNVTVTNSTTITATTPAGSVGAVTVTVTNPGALTGSLANAFTYTVVISSAISYVQSNYVTPQTSQTKVTIPFTSAQTAGDLNVVVVGWYNNTSNVSTVADNSGNPYTLAVGPTVASGTATQSIYYAKNIAAAAAGANSVTVTFSAAAPYPDIRILEYKGADPNTPVDVTAASNGTIATSNSGSATTTNASDLIFGANYIASLTTSPGSGFTERILTSPDGDIAEDQMVTSTGSYSATATLSASGWWVMQMVAFRAAGSGGATSPTISTLSPNSGAVGTLVTITGTNFGSSPGTSTVTFDGTPATPTSWSPTTIVAAVPESATTGNVIVTVGGSASNGVSFSVTSINVTLSPKRAALTMSQTQQFTATVNNDPQNGGVTWSIDGNNGGTAASGIVTSAGLFTPGTQAGVHVVTATSNSSTSMSASATIAVTDLTGVFTYHNDSARTGQNLQEYGLTTATVNSSTFGPLFSCPVDGYVYSTPLYVANFNIGGKTRNVVFIATENDSVYAFDADSPSCVQLWKKSFLASGVTTVSSADVDDANQGDIDPQIGITSTPVIDPSASIIYLTAYTRETVGSGCSSGSPCYIYRLHALDLATGTEKSGGPVAITAPNFNVQYHLQRPALLFNNGNVYVAFGSHGDNNTWQGWLMAYNSTGLTQEWVWHSTNPASGNNEGSIWGSGNGPALDANGNIYVETANGVFDGIANFSDSVVKISPSGAMVDYFTPFDQGIMQQNDIDLGSSGPMILPDALGSSAHPHLVIATGKVGVIYLLDQANLGKYNPAANQDVGESTVGFNTTDVTAGFFSQPAYWNGNIYGAIVGDALRQYPISNGVVATLSSSQSINTFSFRGTAPAVSASGTTNGIVWAVDFSGQQNGTPLVLYAYDATDVSTLLYSSPSSGSGAATAASKFTVPVVANGKVYVVGQSGFTVFGLLPN
ncbi:MAG TPA: IPT/TIG domain-containing protein [Terracidiphilus sp.]